MTVKQKPTGALILTQEGYSCRSILEAKFDAYLHWMGIEHQHQPRVPNLPYIADFKVNDCYIEVAGMMGYRKYNLQLDKKMGAYQATRLKVQYYFEADVLRLYTGCPLPVRFIKRLCLTCGKSIYDLVNRMCRPCNRKAWGKSEGQSIQCSFCHNSFIRNAGSPNTKFCSRACYWESLKDPIPMDWIMEQAKTRSIRSIALELHLNPNTIYMRLYRQAKRKDTA